MFVAISWSQVIIKSNKVKLSQIESNQGAVFCFIFVVFSLSLIVQMALAVRRLSLAEI
jgi:hypothetical protein